MESIFVSEKPAVLLPYVALPERLIVVEVSRWWCQNTGIVSTRARLHCSLANAKTMRLTDRFLSIQWCHSYRTKTRKFILLLLKINIAVNPVMYNHHFVITKYSILHIFDFLAFFQKTKINDSVFRKFDELRKSG